MVPFTESNHIQYQNEVFPIGPSCFRRRLRFGLCPGRPAQDCVREASGHEQRP